MANKGIKHKHFCDILDCLSARNRLQFCFNFSLIWKQTQLLIQRFLTSCRICLCNHIYFSNTVFHIVQLSIVLFLYAAFYIA